MAARWYLFRFNVRNLWPGTPAYGVAVTAPAINLGAFRAPELGSWIGHEGDEIALMVLGLW